MDPVFFDKKTCGTCKKAQAFLKDKQVKFDVVDIISSPPDRELLEKFIDAREVKSFLNSRSAIYRDLKLGQNIPDKTRAIDLMLKDPNLIKRPFIVRGSVASFGFDPAEFQELWMHNK